MNITPSYVAKNKYLRTAVIGGLIVIGYNALDGNPVAEKRKSIIASMNRVLNEDSIKLEADSKCTIVVEGKEQGMQAILVCDDAIVHVKKFPKHTGTQFITEVNGVQVNSSKKLKEDTGCMVIQEEGYMVMDPPDCSGELKDRNIL